MMWCDDIHYVLVSPDAALWAHVMEVHMCDVWCYVWCYVLMMWWCSLCPGLPRRRSVGTCDDVVTAPAGHSGAQWAADNNNLLWRPLHSKYNMYLIIHSITFCFYTIILSSSSSMSVFSSNNWYIHFQFLRFIHFDAFMPFLTSIKRAVSVLFLTSHIHLILIW